MKALQHPKLLSSYQERYYGKVAEYHELMFDLMSVVSELHSKYRYAFFDRISEEECYEIINDISNGTYQLSPILVYSMKMDEIESFTNRKTVVSSAICGLLHTYPSQQEGYLTIARPSTERDVLLIAALERLLLERTVDWKCPRIENLVYDFYSDINKMVCVNRIYRIDIDFPSPIGFFLINISEINLKPDTLVYQFLTSFLDLPYIDENGLCLERRNWTYTVGNLKRIIHNLVLNETFDYEFRKAFPGVAFTRFVSQVVIGTKDSDEVVFNEEAGYALLKSLGLTGLIVSIGHGDPPISCYGMDVNIEKTL